MVYVIIFAKPEGECPWIRAVESLALQDQYGAFSIWKALVHADRI